MSNTEQRPEWLTNFVNVYQQLSTNNLHNLAQIYDQNVEFQDAVTKITGYDNLLSYFHDMYTNVAECRFHIYELFHANDHAALYWTMTLSHPKLNRGRAFEVDGHSLIKGRDGKVYFHKDYVDLGAMIYERIPLIGKLVSKIKKRMG
jgi:ketosteroid isomerase-like protein